MINHHKLIGDLGGPHALGDALRNRGIDVKNVTVRSWTLPGRVIPAKYWLHILAIAGERSVPCSVDDLVTAAAHRPAADEARAA